MTQSCSTQTATGFEIRFQSLFRGGRGLAFPCNREGQVDLDVMSERARNNYFFACATIGLEYAVPVVKVSEVPLQPVIAHRSGQGSNIIGVKLGDREVTEVERIVVGRPVDAEVPVRYEGDVVIHPVVEERLVTRKQLAAAPRSKRSLDSAANDEAATRPREQAVARRPAR